MGSSSYKIGRDKLAFAGLLFLLAFAITLWIWVELCSAADIKLAWDQNQESDLAGYNVYYGTTARTGTDPKMCYSICKVLTPPCSVDSPVARCGYTGKLAIGKLTPTDVSPFILSDLVKGTTYWISVTAFDDSGNESAFSNEVNGPAKDYTIPIDPKNMRIVP